MRLAIQFGCTLGELCQRMTREEFVLWRAFYRIEPMPDPWLQTGQTCSTMANLFTKRRWKPADFMPDCRPQREQTAEEQMMFFSTIASGVDQQG